MSKKKVADKKFREALDAINKSGESTVNYRLSYLRGMMEAEGKSEHLHEWDDAHMSIKLKREQIH